MISNILVFIILLSGSVFFALFLDKRIEDTLPITAMGICAISFLTGVCGMLNLGVYISIFICIIFYLVTFFRIIKNRNDIKENSLMLARNILTPGFFVFLIFYLSMNYFLYGLKGNSFDEFSHWMTCICNMVKHSDFSTNPLSTDLYASYPPATALFQYFFQRISIFCDVNRTFIEWKCYLAYITFMFIITMPMFRKTVFKDYVKVIGISVITILFPMLFFNNVYHELLVDPFMAVLSGVSISTIVLRDKDEKDIFYHITIMLMLFTLVLSKDIGMLLAIFACVVYIVDILFDRKENSGKFFLLKDYNNLYMLFSMVVVIITKSLWKYEIRNVVKFFPNQVDLKDLAKIILGRTTEGYRVVTYKNYWAELGNRILKFGTSNIGINYYVVLLITVFLIFVGLGVYKNEKSYQIKKRRAFFIILTFEMISYYLGMCVIFMYNFREYEALQYASLDRYLNIVILSTALVGMYSLINNRIMLKNSYYNIIAGIIIIIVLLVIPQNEVIDVLVKKNVDNSILLRNQFDVITQKLLKTCDGDDFVLMINQGGQPGYDGLIEDYNIMPNRCVEVSVGEPCWDGDIWTIPMESCDDFMMYIDTELGNYQVDYLCLFRLNDYFIEHFSDMFDDPDSIKENCIYKYNYDSGKLSYIE